MKLRQEGNSYPEIARRVGASVGTVYKDIHGEEVFKNENLTVTGRDGKSYPATKPPASRLHTRDQVALGVEDREVFDRYEEAPREEHRHATFPAKAPSTLLPRSAPSVPDPEPADAPPAQARAEKAPMIEDSTPAPGFPLPFEHEAEPLRAVPVTPQTEAEILAAAREIKARRAEERRQERIEKIRSIAAEANPLTEDLGSFAVVYADPPWSYEQHQDSNRGVTNHYPTMAIEDICALPVQDITTPDAILFLWPPRRSSLKRSQSSMPGASSTRPQRSGTRKSLGWASG